MSFTETGTDPRARDVAVSDADLTVHLVDGRTLIAPLKWFPRLQSAAQDQRDAWELLGGGVGIHWPSIDEDISVAGLIRGKPAA